MHVKTFRIMRPCTTEKVNAIYMNLDARVTSCPSTTTFMGIVGLVIYIQNLFLKCIIGLKSY